MVTSSSPASVASPSPLGAALARAIAQLRTTLEDPLAPITVIVPAGPNGVLARRALATQGPILRVWFETPDGLLNAQLPASSWKTLRPEPAGWLRVTLADCVQTLSAHGQLGRFGPTLTRRGWRNPLAGALARLEREGIRAADLLALDVATTPQHVRERAALLATLLTAIDAARQKEQLASASALAKAATDAIGVEAGVGASLAQGAVLLGDRELSFTTFQFLSTWLKGRPVVAVNAVSPLAHAPAALQGIFQAAPHATAIGVETPSVQTQFARTADDVRECLEAVRQVHRAIEAGVALDRIAIVLPDSAQRGPLEEALDRAQIPATCCACTLGPLGELLARKADVPRVAFEIEAADTVVEAELAFESAKVAVFLELGAGLAPALQNAGWQVFIGVGPMQDGRVAAALGLSADPADDS